MRGRAPSILLGMGLLIGLSVPLAGCLDEAEPRSYTGYVEAEWVYPGSTGSGRLVSLEVAEGDQVERGAVLGKLDAEDAGARWAEANAALSAAQHRLKDLQSGARQAEIDALNAQRAEAQAALDYARSERRRIEELVSKGHASPSRLDAVTAEERQAAAKVESLSKQVEVAALPARSEQIAAAEAEVEAAHARTEQARWMLSERTITAQRAGRIEDILHREGEVMSPGAPLVALLPRDGLKVRFFLPEAHLSRAALGDSVWLKLDGAPERPIEAKITFVSEEAEFTPPVIYSEKVRDKLVFRVEAAPVDPAGLRPGQPLDVYLERPAP